jgi:5-methylcytosine-specific restriction endonuclease McrA
MGEARTCIICDKGFWVVPNVAKKGGGKFCSKFCYGFEKMLKSGEFRECPTCQHVFHVSSVQIRRKKGRFCSSECYDRGITPLLNRIRGIWIYEVWRRAVLKRDNYTCQQCGIQDKVMEAHHLKRFSVILHEHDIESVEQARKCKELWDVENGKTFCVPCHRDLELSSIRMQPLRVP